MKKINFNKDWSFTFENNLESYTTFGLAKYSDASGAAARFSLHNNWDKVDLPHDWAVSLPKDPLADPFAGGYPKSRYHRQMSERRANVKEVYSVGWYRKEFIPEPEWEGKRLFLEFEGIYRDAIVWVNGVYLDRHASGYTGFALELTDHLVFGEQNSVAVRVDCDQPEGWWYEGAGIYRNVNLLVAEPLYFQYRQTVITAQVDGNVQVKAVLINDSDITKKEPLSCQIHDPDGKLVAESKSEYSLFAFGSQEISQELSVAEPKLWSVDAPNLYTLTLTLGKEQEQIPFGIRSVAFDPDRGFLLNGAPLKIRGACVHQDFGGVGTALTDNLQYYKIKRLKEMGVNAYRCSHHAPSPVLLDACDRLGMLVMDETRMFGTSPEALRQLKEVIERDRNHPCVFIWCLGNEEFSVQSKERSYHLMEKMSRIAKSLDPTRPVTYAGNNGANYIGANRASEIRGINYIRNDKSGKWIDVYHKEHPHQPIIGTEESSYVLSRGGAVNDLGSGLLDSYGTVTMPWGSTPKGWVKYSEIRDHFAGSFMWTGFDYHGEPNPFYYSNTSSSFGTIDLCGMEKPPFYYYKAWWLKEPVLKLAPHWNHKEGETVTVAVFTNCESISLSLNGKHLETRKVEPFDSPLFQVVYEPGVLQVEGVKEGKTYLDRLETAGELCELRCTPVWEAKSAEDIAIYEISAHDAKGLLCPLASQELEVSVENGSIFAVGNGDPASADYEQKPKEEECRYFYTFNTDDGVYSLPTKKPNCLGPRSDWFVMEEPVDGYEDDFRRISQYRTYTGSPRELTKELSLSIFDAEGFEYVEFERISGLVSVYLNGEKLGENHLPYMKNPGNSSRPYRFYGKFQKGENCLKLVFTYRKTDLPLLSGYAKIGKGLSTPWKVKLHYGKARVFVKTATPQACKLTAKQK